MAALNNYEGDASIGFAAAAQKILLVIGLIWTVKFVVVALLELVQAIKVYILQPLQLLNSNQDWIKSYGPWAVVTGATDGVGKEYAKQLAGKGINIVLISRSLDKLNAVAAEIIREHGVKTKVIQADFSSDLSLYHRLAKELENIEIGILVNNVGVFSPEPMLLTEMDLSNLWQHVSVNVGAVTMMTRIVLPQMLARQKGGIINLSSAASNRPSALMAAYCASKVYVNYFTEGIMRECAGQGVTVQCLTPLFIATNMTSYNDRVGKPSLFVPDARQYVRSALHTFGTLQVGSGYLTHAVQILGITVLPTKFVDWVTYQKMKGLRQKKDRKNM